MGAGAPRVLRPGHRRRPRARAAELHAAPGRARRSRVRLRTRSVLRRMARHAAVELRESRHTAGDDRDAREDRRTVRWRALRHGDAGAPRRVRADVGPPRGALLAASHRARARAGARLLLHGRGLLGSRMDAAAAGIRLHLRQAAVRPAPRRARPADPRAPPRRPRLPEQDGPLPGKPRRAARGRDVPAGRHEAAAVITLPVARAALLSSGAIRRTQEADLSAPGSRSGRARRRPAAAILRTAPRRDPKLPAVRDGDWRLLECTPAWDGNWTSDCFIAWLWTGTTGDRRLVAVNYAANQSQCYVRLPPQDRGDRPVRFDDLMGTARFNRDPGELDARGLYLDVPAWGYHVFDVTAHTP